MQIYADDVIKPKVTVIIKQHSVKEAHYLYI